MSYASLLGLPDTRETPVWLAWAQAEHEVPEGLLDERLWEWGDQPTYARVGTRGLAIRYESGALTLEFLDPTFADESGVASACADSCTCCLSARTRPPFGDLARCAGRGAPRVDNDPKEELLVPALQMDDRVDGARH